VNPSSAGHFEVEQVSGRVWAAIATPAGGAVGNAAFVDLGGRSLVVDAGYTPTAARELRAAAERLAGPVERLVITHADFDHYGGAQAFADVPILASERTRATIGEIGPTRIEELAARVEAYLAELEERNAPEWEREQGRVIAAEIPGLELTVPSERFEGEVDLEGVRVLDCGAGHTDSDSVVWVPGDGVLVAADLLGVGSHLNLTRGDPENWLRSLDRFDALQPERVVPGHGSVAGPEAIAVARRYIETLLRLADEPGEQAMPLEYESWEFGDGFQRNLEALRARQPA
jgi:glyoxylase-like metal-dependent hydrolase (beta-lactamase superfamily II)